MPQGYRKRVAEVARGFRICAESVNESVKSSVSGVIYQTKQHGIESERLIELAQRHGNIFRKGI